MANRQTNKSKNFWFILGVITVAIAAFFIFENYVFPQISGWLTNKTTSEVIALCTLFVAILAASCQIIFYRLTHYPIINLELKFTQVGELTALIETKVENSGDGKLISRTAHLLIDEGVKVGTTYAFPNLMSYQQDKKHCQLGYVCHSEIAAYPANLVDDGRFQNTFSAFFSLKYLSQALSYIGKSEWFSESVIVNFPKPGVYRTIFVFSTSDDRCRCRCVTAIIGELKDKAGSK